jgi:hypothetical protein
VRTDRAEGAQVPDAPCGRGRVTPNIKRPACNVLTASLNEGCRTSAATARTTVVSVKLDKCLGGCSHLGQLLSSPL